MERSYRQSYKHVIFDFDGVLAETNEIRVEGFRLLFKDYLESQVKKLVNYAERNGGMSRFEKIRYFFEEIRHEAISPENVQFLAKRYSGLVKQKVIAAAPVKGSLIFLTSYSNDYDFAVISGSEQEELREVCCVRGVEHFFVEILGSPVRKENNLTGLLSGRGWKKEACVFVGDSINDLNTARANGIDFIARNSGTTDWSLVKGVHVIGDLSELKSSLDLLEG